MVLEWDTHVSWSGWHTQAGGVQLCPDKVSAVGGGAWWLRPMVSPPAHTERERESREREKTRYFPEVLFRSVQTKWCAVYSQKVALWDQILALSSPLPLLPCSLVCFLREGGREGVKSEGGGGGCTTHTCLYQPSTVQHKYNSNLWKASLHQLLISVPFFSSSAFAWAFNRAFLCLRCLFFSSEAERLPAGE